MKKRPSITELLDRLRTGRGGENEEALKAEEREAELNEEEREHTADDEALMRLGRALIERLNMPEGMSVGEAVEAVLSVWENEGEAPAPEAHEEVVEEETEEAPAPRRLPKPIRGDLASSRGADYESMSAEQFRRLKKQIKKADMDGKKIRL